MNKKTILFYFLILVILGGIILTYPNDDLFFARGAEEDIPELREGEPGFANNKELFIGSEDGNIAIRNTIKGSKKFAITNQATGHAINDMHSKQAVYSEEVNKTFIVFRGKNAASYATAIDHNTGAKEGTYFIGDTTVDHNDNHDTPSLTIDDQGYIHVFYGSHAANSNMRYAISEEPYDITNWEDRDENIDTVVSTYPSPVFHDGVLYVMHREYGGYFNGETSGLEIIYSEDYGETWNYGELTIDFGDGAVEGESGTIYPSELKVYKDKLHIAFTFLDGEKRSGIYYVVYDPASDEFEKYDGTSLGKNLDWNDSDDLEIYKSDYDYGPQIFWDEGTDDMLILFSTYNDITKKIDYVIEKFDGTNWTHHEVGASTHHRLHRSSIRYNQNLNMFEGLFVTGLEDKQSTLELESPAEIGSRWEMGANLTYWTSENGEDWSKEQTIMDIGEAPFQGTDVVQAPLNSTNELKFLINNAVGNRLITKQLLGWTNEKFSLNLDTNIDKMRGVLARRPQIENIITVNNKENSWDEVFDISEYIPPNAEELYVRASLRSMEIDSEDIPGSLAVVFTYDEDNFSGTDILFSYQIVAPAVEHNKAQMFRIPHRDGKIEVRGTGNLDTLRVDLHGYYF